MLVIANWMALGLGIYMLIGLLFAVWYVTVGVRHAPIEGKAVVLRLMLLPGAMLLWPLLILRRRT